MAFSALEIPETIEKKLLNAAAKEAFLVLGEEFEVNLKFVPKKEMERLNWVYRHKEGVTDVLSFKNDDENGGDIVLYLPLVKKRGQRLEYDNF